MLGNRSKCSEHAHERFAEIPKIRQLESLRQFLIEYDLFDPKRDPETALIGLHELKQLVRKWNLHQGRNFWRDNTTRDDIVRELYKHKLRLEAKSRERAAHAAEARAERNRGSVAQKLGNRGDKHRRAKSPDPIDENTLHHHEVDIQAPKAVLSFNISPPDEVIASWKRRDIFKYAYGFVNLARGLSPEGLGYLRIKQIDHPPPRDLPTTVDKRFSKGRFSVRPSVLVNNAESTSVSPGSGYYQPGDSVESEMEEEEGEEDGAATYVSSLVFRAEGPNSDVNNKIKLNCSVALFNISLRSDAVAIFLEQNALQDVLELMNSTLEHDVLRNCGACLVNVTRTGEGIMRLFQSTIVSSLIRLARLESEYLKQVAAMALAQLTCHEGTELWLIQEGAVTGFNQLMHAHNSYTRLIAVQALINLLTYVPPQRIETVTISIMKCIFSLSTIPNADVQQLVAEALEVLSSYSAVRHLITEAGGVQVLTYLMNESSHAEERTMATCALAIANMAQVKRTRKDLVSMGICKILINLLKVGDHNTKVICSQALLQLSREEDLRENLVTEGVLPTVATLLLQGNDKLALLAVLNIVNFSSDPLCQMAVIKQDLGEALVKILQQNSNGVEVQKLSVQAIVQLVHNEEALDALMSWGAIEAMNELVSTGAYGAAIGRAYFVISTFQTLRLRLAEKAVVPSLLALLAAETNDRSVNIACLGALQYMSLVDKTDVFFRNIGIVQSLSDSLGMKGDAMAGQYSAAILYNLSLHEVLCRDLYEDGATVLLINLAKMGNEATKYYSSAALYNMSQRHLLTRETGFVKGLVELTSTHMSERQLLCSKIFANASMNPKGRSALGSDVSVLQCLCKALRSTIEDCDKIQYFSALAICNALSVYFKSKEIEDMVALGVVKDLAVIMMLRVNDVKTKTLLGKALFNLMVREDTRELVDGQDVTQSLLRLVKLQNPELSLISMQAVTNMSSELERFGAKLGRIRAVNIFITEIICEYLQQARDRLLSLEVKTLCATALANLSFEPSCRSAIAHDDFVMGLRCIALGVDGQCLEDIATVLCNLASDVSCHEFLVEKKAIKLITHLMTTTGGAPNATTISQLCLASLCSLSTTEKSHPQLVAEAMTLIASSIRSTTNLKAARLDATRLLCNLVQFYVPARAAAVETRCVTGLADLIKSLQEEEDVAMIGKILREMSSCEEARSGMIQDGVMAVLFKLAKQDWGAIKLDAAEAIANLSYTKLKSIMLEHGVVESLYWLILEDCLHFNTPIYQRCSIVLRNMMLVTEGVKTRAIMDEARFLKIAFKMSQYVDDQTVQLNAAIALYHIASHKPTQTLVVKKGIIPVLIDLAELGVPLIRQICSAAMHNLPVEATEGCTDNRLVKILMTMLNVNPQNLATVEQVAPPAISRIDPAWTPAMALFYYPRREAKVSWESMLVDLDPVSRPYTPASISLEDPKLPPPQNEARAVSVCPPNGLGGTIGAGGNNNKDNRDGEFRKLTLKIEKLLPADLAPGLELKGSKLIPSVPRGSVSVPLPITSLLSITNNQDGHEDDDSEENLDGQEQLFVSGARGSVSNNNNNNNKEGNASSKLPMVPSSSQGNTRRPSPPSSGVGHQIITESDRNKHSKYVKEMGKLHILPSSIRAKAVASNFATMEQRGLQTMSVSVLEPLVVGGTGGRRGSEGMMVRGGEKEGGGGGGGGGGRLVKTAPLGSIAKRDRGGGKAGTR